LKPTFKVKARNQPEDTLLNTQTVNMKRNDVWQSGQLSPQWNSISIIALFKDGNEEHKCPLTVPKAVLNGTCGLVSAAVDSNILTIRSR
jgi:hypothetical protein